MGAENDTKQNQVSTHAYAKESVELLSINFTVRTPYCYSFLRQDVISLCWPLQTPAVHVSVTNRIQKTQETVHEKALLQMALVFSPFPSGSALYWQSRMVKAFVKVWDRTVWHSSHTTWMAHQITLHHNLLFKAQFYSVVEMISLHTDTIWCYIWNSLKVNIW